MIFKIEKNVAAVGALFFLCVHPSFASERCKTGVITESHGEVLRESPMQAKVEHLKSGLCVSDGQALITRKGASLGVSLSSGSTLNVAPESELLIGFPIGGKPTKLNVTRGEIKVKYGTNDGPVVNALRLTIKAKTAGTVLYGEVFHDGQEAFLVVTRGSAIARLGNEGAGVVVSAGQSVYVTESQKEVPRVVGLDSREMETLAEDHSFKQTLSQLLMVESGAEAKPDSAVDSSQDLTLEQYSAEEKAQKKIALPPPPVVTTLPLTPMPNETPRPRPVALPETPPMKPVVAQVKPEVAPTTPPHANQTVMPITEEKPIEKEVSLSSVRFEVGPSFYSDSTGLEVGAKYLAPLTRIFKSLNDYNGTDLWSLGVGVGYSHASKDTLSVNNWKLAATVNYRCNLASAVSMLPEFSLGAGIENVSVPTKTYGSGIGLYYSPDLLFELNIDRAPHFHPGVAFIEQGYLGSASLTSVAIEYSMRFEF
jgi:antitoxin (DNA-binding transcriptional repressor) of toxin-antitoxin stability system